MINEECQGVQKKHRAVTEGDLLKKDMKNSLLGEKLSGGTQNVVRKIRYNGCGEARNLSGLCFSYKLRYIKLFSEPEVPSLETSEPLA